MKNGIYGWDIGQFFISPIGIFDAPPTVTRDARLVYLCLAKFANNATKQSFPSYERIMKETQIKSKKAITAALNCLKEHGLLTVEKRYKRNSLKGGKATNRYTLVTKFSSDTELSNQKEGLSSDMELNPPPLSSDVELNPPPLSSNTERELYLDKDITILSNTDLTRLNLTVTKTEEKKSVKSSQVESSTHSNIKNSDKEKKKSRDEITAEVKKQIQYDWLKEQLDTPILDEVLGVLVNGLCSEKEYCKISGEQIPIVEVKARYRERDVTDIERLVHDIMTKTTPIKYPPAYIAAALYRYGDGEHTKYTTMYNADVANGLFAR